MKTKTKASGFFIVEILIVLLIVGILAIALLPNLALYVDKAKFSDNIAAAAALKPAVEFCILKNSTPGGTTIPAACISNAQGIPAEITSGYGGNVDGLVVATGQITATGTTDVGGYTYQLDPALSTNGVITWTVNTDSTCIAAGLC